MLHDTAEKSKNPLKKAMRRRNAKTVTFNPPTYFEAADIDWSDVEQEAEGAPGVIGSAEARRNGGQLDRSGAARTNGTLDGHNNGPVSATGPRTVANETNGRGTIARITCLMDQSANFMQMLDLSGLVISKYGIQTRS
jgi:hypothetical protein